MYIRKSWFALAKPLRSKKRPRPSLSAGQESKFGMSKVTSKQDVVHISTKTSVNSIKGQSFASSFKCIEVKFSCQEDHQVSNSRELSHVNPNYGSLFMLVQERPLELFSISENPSMWGFVGHSVQARHAVFAVVFHK